MSALDGASKYLNNLLLARGLLAEGQPINFAHNGDNVSAADKTMSKVINLVHDLVLRRDRDAEQHETMAAKIRHLQAEEKQNSFDVQRLQDKADLLKNKATTAEALERATKVDMGRLETQLKALKDQNLKMKSMVDQIRAKCVGDIKKRDTEINQLRNHIAGLQRGQRTGTQHLISHKPQKGELSQRGQEWALEQESSDFLKEILNETTAENVALRKIIAHGTKSLREISGMEMQSGCTEEKDGIGIPGQYRKSRQQADMAQADSLVPCHILELDLQRAIEHCKSILRDPSFVPIEEVQLREEEIAKLTAGWEKMADRWKEAVTMMAQWKQRMQHDGERDISGWSDLSFGRSVAVRPNGEPILGQSDLSSIFDQDESVSQTSDTDPDSQDLSSSQDKESESTSISELQPEPQLELEPASKRLASSPAKRGVKLPRTARALSEVSGNASQELAAGSIDLTRKQLHHARSSLDHEDDTFHHRKARLRFTKPNDRPASIKSKSEAVENDSRMTMSQKIAAVEAEARDTQAEQNQKIGAKRKASQYSGENRRSRPGRRSTLSPEELALLINDGS